MTTNKPQQSPAITQGIFLCPYLPSNRVSPLWWYICPWQDKITQYKRNTDIAQQGDMNIILCARKVWPSRY